MNQAIANEVGMQELTVGEIEDVSGGVINVLFICFMGGYWLGGQIYSAATR